MRNHLSAAENYYSCILEIEEITAHYPNGGERFKDIECADDIDMAELDSVFLNCKIKHIDIEKYKENYIDKSLRFEILYPNVEELLKTDFFDVVTIDSQISVKASIWIYMDGNFDYIAEVKIDDEIYLSFDDGLQNIKDYMNNRKGLL